MFKRIFARQAEDATTVATPTAEPESAAGPPPGSYVVCPDLPSYVAAVLDLEEITSGGSAAFPVLHDEKSTVDRSAYSARPYESSVSLARTTGMTPEDLLTVIEDAATTSESSRASACLVVRGDDGAPIGAAHALASNKTLVTLDADRLVEQVAAAAEKHARLTLSLPSSLLGGEGIDRLWRAVVSARPDSEGVEWGILTASSAASLSWLVARLALTPPAADARGIVGRYGMWRGFTEGDDMLRVVEISPESEPLTPALASRRWPLVCMTGHAKTYCGMMGELCSGSVDPATGEGQCIDGFECVVRNVRSDLPWIPVSSFHVDTLLLEACHAANFMCGPQAGRNVVTAALDGNALAVIASNRQTQSIKMLAFLAWEILRRDGTLGYVVRELNRCYVDVLDHQPQYILFGDPERTVFDDSLGPPPVIRAEPDGDRQWKADIPRPVAFTQLVELESRALADAWRHGPITCASETLGDDVAMALFPGSRDDTVRILSLFREAPYDDGYDLVLRSRPSFDEGLIGSAYELENRVACSGVQIAADEPANSLEDPEPSTVEQLGALLVQAEPFLVCMRGRHASHFEAMELARATDLIAEHARAAGREFIRSLAEQCRGVMDLSLASILADRGCGPRGQRAGDEPCPRCGGVVLTTSYGVGFRPCTDRRQIECEACNILCDIEADAAPLVLETPPYLPRGGHGSVSVRGVNHLDRVAFVHALFTARYGEFARHECSFETAVHEAVVRPGEAFSFSSDLDVGLESDRTEHCLQAFVSINGMIALANSAFVIT